MKKKIMLFVCATIMVTLLLMMTACNSLAIWSEERTKEVTIVSEEEVNPSLRYQIFAPLDSLGRLILYEDYSFDAHGAIGFSYITSEGNNVAYKDPLDEDADYTWANFEQLDAGENLYQVSSSAPYKNATHGALLYEKSTSVGFPILVSRNGSYAVPSDDELKISANKTYYIEDEDENEQIVYIQLASENAAVYGELVGSGKSAGGYQLFYRNSSGEYDYATSSQVISGKNLYVLSFSSYDPDDPGEYGSLVYSNQTSRGYTLCVKDGNIYSTATSEQVGAGGHLYAIGNISTYALVGYTGIVAELVVPDEYTDIVTKRTYPITRICTHPDYMDEALAGNDIITSIVIGKSVSSLGALVFSNMKNLHDITFVGSNAITIGDYAFLSCVRLEHVVCGSALLMDSVGREVNADNDVFTGCPNRDSEGFLS